jgi:hypothetical protein
MPNRATLRGEVTNDRAENGRALTLAARAARNTVVGQSEI